MSNNLWALVFWVGFNIVGIVLFIKYVAPDPNKPGWRPHP